MQEHSLRFVDLVRLSLRSFRVKPVRAILTVAGMSVGIGTVLFLVSLGYGLQYILIGKLVTTQESLVTMEIVYPQETGKSIDAAELDVLTHMPEVAAVSPVYEFPGEVGQIGNSALLVNTQEVSPDFFRLSGLSPDIGEKLEPGEPGMVVTSQTLRALGMAADESSLGKPLTFKVFYDTGNTHAEEASTTEPLRIEGIISDEQLSPTAIVLTSVVSKPPPFTYKALVQAKDIDHVEKVRDLLISEGFVVSARIDLVSQAQKIMNTITIVLGVFGITALFVSAIGMFNTMIVGFMERTYEVGILKSLGATDEDVRNLFLMEATLMGILGGVGGILLGYGGGKLMNLSLSALAVRLGGKPFDLFITPLWFMILVLTVSIVIGIISGYWPAHQASKLSPKEAFVRK